MSNHYSDFEKLRPTGEASHIPDTKLDGGCDGNPRRQRVATSTGGYPDAPTVTDGECRFCGASIPDRQTKCRFCLTNHLGDTAADATDTIQEPTLVGIVFTLVESSTFYGAVAKGAAAGNLLVASETEEAIDAHRLIYDLEDEPAPQIANRWPTLPAAVPITSAAGERLFTAARDRNGWTGQPATVIGQETTPCLYDESGTGIRDEQHLTTVVDDAGDEIWLIPAISLQQATYENGVDSYRNKMPIRESLECQRCGRATDHKFSDSESLPDEKWAGQSIWECQVCGTSRYGPAPTNRR